MYIRKSKNVNKNKGFTIVELLIVILIIGILGSAVISLVNPAGIQRRSRDAQRVSDLRMIQSALELHFAENRSYPNPGSDSWIRLPNSSFNSIMTPTYMSAVPVDPLNTGGGNGPCQSPTSNRYNYLSNGGTYILTAIMELETSNTDNECTSLSNWGNSCNPMTTQDFCYGVQNP